MQRLATQAGCVPVVGLMGESALGTLAGLQFAATIAKPALPAELTWFLAMIEQVSEWMPQIVRGTITLPEVRVARRAGRLESRRAIRVLGIFSRDHIIRQEPLRGRDGGRVDLEVGCKCEQ